MLRRAAMWMSSQQPAKALSSPPMTFFPYPPKRDSLLYVARHGAVTLTCNAPSKALRPADLCLKGRTFRRSFLLVLAVVESFPGAQSPLGSKEPIELFLSSRKVFVSATRHPGGSPTKKLE